MRKSWSMCVLLGALAWGQVAPPAPSPQAGQTPGGNTAAAQAPAAPVDTSASVPPDAPVLTIKGVCSTASKTISAKTASDKTTAPASKHSAESAASKTPAADCKTVITKAEFEKIANGLSPNMTPQLKHQLATVLPRLMALSQATEIKDLEKTPPYTENL